MREFIDALMKLKLAANNVTGERSEMVKQGDIQAIDVIHVHPALFSEICSMPMVRYEDLHRDRHGLIKRVTVLGIDFKVAEFLVPSQRPQRFF